MNQNLLLRILIMESWYRTNVESQNLGSRRDSLGDSGMREVVDIGMVSESFLYIMSRAKLFRLKIIEHYVFISDLCDRQITVSG